MTKINSDLLDEKLVLRDELSSLVPQSAPPIGSQLNWYADSTGAFKDINNPNNLYPGTVWISLFNNEGVFFRTEGGNSAENRTNGKQPEMFKSHNHTKSGTDAGASANGGKYVISNNGGVYSTSVNDAGGTETRPVNRLIRIMERTA
jgi:hypothetical protein